MTRPSVRSRRSLYNAAAKLALCGTPAGCTCGSTGCKCTRYVTFKGFTYTPGVCQCWDAGNGTIIPAGIKINSIDLNRTFQIVCTGSNSWQAEIECDIDYWLYDGVHSQIACEASEPTGKCTSVRLMYAQDAFGAYLEVRPLIFGTVVIGGTTVSLAASDPLFHARVFAEAPGPNCYLDALFCNERVLFNTDQDPSSFAFACSVVIAGNGCAKVHDDPTPPDFDCTTCNQDPYRRARDCITHALIDVWVKKSAAGTFIDGFHVVGSSPVVCGYFDLADDPIEALGGTEYVPGQLTAHACGACPLYRQARSCDDNSLANVWMSNVEAIASGACFYTNSPPYTCYYFDFTDPTHDTPTGTVYSAASVTPSVFPCNRCPGYLQALKCSDNSPSGFWMPLPAANSIFSKAFTVNTAAGGDGVTCYHFVSGETIDAIPGTIINPLTDITLRGDCAACLKYCYYKYSSSFVCPDGPWTTPVLVATQCLAEDPADLNEWDIAPVVVGSTSAIWWQKGGPCQEDGDCPEDPNDPPDAPITLPGDCGVDCPEDITWFHACGGGTDSTWYNENTHLDDTQSVASLAWNLTCTTLTGIPSIGTITDIPFVGDLTWEKTDGDLTYHVEVSGCADDPPNSAGSILWIRNNVTGEQIFWGVNGDSPGWSEASTTTNVASGSGVSAEVTNADSDINDFDNCGDLSATIDNKCPHP